MTGTLDRNPVGARILSQKKYLVTLTSDERGHLDDLLREGKASALVLPRARVLLGPTRRTAAPPTRGGSSSRGFGRG